jgi:nitrile hydratase accessory protein
VNEERVFREPWEAQAFALTVALHERGAFTWPEWSAALAEEIARAGDADRGEAYADSGEAYADSGEAYADSGEAYANSGEAYYHHWLRALERLVDDRRLTDAVTLERYRRAWKRAAERTPHGTPIELADVDFATAE